MSECQCSESEYVSSDGRLTRRVHAWHSCQYVALRNSKIHAAFVASRLRPTGDDIDPEQFMAAMDRLVAEHYTAARGR